MKGACWRDIAVSRVAVPEDADSSGLADVPQPLVTLKREQCIAMLEATHDLQVMNQLYLELSQFTTAKTAREVFLECVIREANECLRSAHHIASRKGEVVAWNCFLEQIEKCLNTQQPILYGSRKVWQQDDDEE